MSAHFAFIDALTTAVLVVAAAVGSVGVVLAAVLFLGSWSQRRPRRRRRP